MKKKASNKATDNTQNMINYTRTKDAYDGNMELTNLKATSQKISRTIEPLTEGIGDGVILK